MATFASINMSQYHSRMLGYVGDGEAMANLLLYYETFGSLTLCLDMVVYYSKLSLVSLLLELTYIFADHRAFVYNGRNVGIPSTSTPPGHRIKQNGPPCIP